MTTLPKKPAGNRCLARAKEARDDEFYTRLQDIEAELSHYPDLFRGKVVYCNCDDPAKSNFWRYFYQNFERLGLLRLIATHYTAGQSSYKLEYCGHGTEPIRTALQGDGDFRSPACVELLKAADIVVTNPPFSLFRFYFSLLRQHDKPFIFLGPLTGIASPAVSPSLVSAAVVVRGKKAMPFHRPDGSLKAAPVVWYTCLACPRSVPELPLQASYADREHRYPQLDAQDAIHAPRLDEIPHDYYGPIAAPITYVPVHNPQQFELLAFLHGPVINGKRLFKRCVIKRRPLPCHRG